MIKSKNLGDPDFDENKNEENTNGRPIKSPEKNGQGENQTVNAELGEINMLSRAESLAEVVPDAFVPYLEVVQPYTSRLLGWFYKAIGDRKSSQDQLFNPINALTKKPLDLVLGLYHSATADTWLEELEREFQSSNSYREFVLSLLERTIDQAGEIPTGTNKKIDDLKTRNRILSVSNEQLNEKLKDLSAENELVVRENHHSIINSLQGLIGSLKLKKKESIDGNQGKSPNKTLKEVIRSLETVISIHQQLMNPSLSNNEFASVDQYLREVTDSLVDVFVPGQSESALTVSAQSLHLRSEKLSSIGMIVNELVTNSLQHGYDPGNSPAIEVSLSAENGEVNLFVEDTGKGTNDKNDDGLEVDDINGLGIVRKIVENQLNGTFAMDDNGTGASWKITFPLEPSEIRHESHQNKKRDSSTTEQEMSK